MKNYGLNSMQRFAVHRLTISGLMLLVLCIVSSCRDRSAVSPVQPKDSPAAVGEQARVEMDQEKSCREFVQGFYDWYFDRLNSENKEQSNVSALDDVLRLKPELLTARLRQMLKEDREAASKNPGEIVGLDFDPYINAQDWEGKYSAESVTVKSNSCRASVWGMDGGAKKEIVVPELELTGRKWAFANFHYPGQSDPREENLIDLLTGLRDDRKHSHRNQAP